MCCRIYGRLLFMDSSIRRILRGGELRAGGGGYAVAQEASSEVPVPPCHKLAVPNCLGMVLKIIVLCDEVRIPPAHHSGCVMVAQGAGTLSEKRTFSRSQFCGGMRHEERSQSRLVFDGRLRQMMRGILMTLEWKAYHGGQIGKLKWLVLKLNFMFVDYTAFEVSQNQVRLFKWMLQ